MDLIDILRVSRISQHNSTCVKSLLPWQLKLEQWPFVGRTKANCLYKCIDGFSVRHNTIDQLNYN